MVDKLRPEAPASVASPPPSDSSPAVLEVRLFGQPEFRRGNSALPPLATRKTQSLLAYLVLRRARPHSRDELATLFWGDLGDTRARRSLATALWRIRRLLVDDIYLIADSSSIQFNPASPFWLDVADFQELLLTPQPQNGVSPIDRWRRAAELWRGDLLEGFYDDWCVEERYRLEELYLKALKGLVTAYTSSPQPEQALPYIGMILARDPLQEDIQRTAIRLYAQLGQRAEALRQARWCREVIRAELGTEPTPETIALCDQWLGPSWRREPVDEMPAPRPSRQTPVSLLLEHPPFVGREAECKTLLQSWDQARSGHGGLVLIGGEAGVGKSRLTEEFSGVVHWNGGMVARGRCCEPERVLLYQPLAEVLRDLLAMNQEGGTRGLPDWVRAEIARLIPEMATPSRRREYPSSDPRRERQAILFHAVAAFVRHFATHVPLLVVLEDLHWATDSLIAGLHYLARQARDMRVLILGTYRPEELNPSHPLTTMRSQLASESWAEQLLLKRLSSDDVAELVFRLSGQARDASASQADADRVRQLYAHTEGNALFLIETLRELENPWRDVVLPVPNTVRELIRVRLGRLSAPTRAIAECAAVAGRMFDFDLVYHAEGGKEESALDAIDELLHRGFLREGNSIAGHEYEFAHSLIHQVVYTSLNYQRRRYLHRIIGETLENLRGEPQEELASTLAHHFEAGGNLEKALHYHDLAAQRAKSLFAWREAEEHQSRMLDLLDRLDPGRSRLDRRTQRARVLEDRAYQRFLQGRLAERDADLSASAALAEASRDECLRLQTLAQRVRYLNLDGHYAEAIAVGEEGVALASRLDDISARCHFLTQIGFARYFRGEFEAANRALQAALALEPADPAARGEVLSVLSYTFYLIADYERSLDYRQQALALHSRLGQVDREALDRIDMGILYTRMNRLPEADKYLRDALALAQKIGSQVAESYALNNLGTLLYLRGDFTAALDSYSHSLLLQRATGSRRGEASSLANSGIARVALGDYAGAESLLRQSLAIQEKIGYQSGLAEGLAHLARALAGLGRVDEALTTASRSLAMAQQISDRSCQVTALNVLAWLHLINNEPETALGESRGATSLAVEIGAVHGRVFGLALTALAQMKLGNPKLACSYSCQAIEVLREQEGIEGPEEAVYLAHSLVLAALGRTEQAANALNEAEAKLQAKADRISDPDSRRRYLDSWTLRSLPRL